MTLAAVESVSGTSEGEATRRPFTCLAREFYQPVYYFIARQAPNSADAADITQQVFIQAFKSFERFDQTREFAPWIYTIARRGIADFYRRRRHVPEALDHAVEDPGPDPGQQAADREGADQLWQLAASLKPKFFQVLLLHYKEGFSLVETAHIMGISTTHAKVLLFRARNALKERLAKSESMGGIVL